MILGSLALSLAGWDERCHAANMKSYLKLIQFWVLMAVLGASAWAEEGEPPLFHSFTVKTGEQEAGMKDRNDLTNVVAHGTPSRLVLTIADPKGQMKLPKLGGLIKFLKGDS